MSYETKEECIAHGGHCWERSNMVLDSLPPQYPEYCKYCPARRIGIPQDSMRYYDPDE